MSLGQPPFGLLMMNNSCPARQPSTAFCRPDSTSCRWGGAGRPAREPGRLRCRRRADRCRDKRMIRTTRRVVRAPVAALSKLMFDHIARGAVRKSLPSDGSESAGCFDRPTRINNRQRQASVFTRREVHHQPTHHAAPSTRSNVAFPGLVRVYIGNHDVWLNPANMRKVSVPRHRSSSRLTTRQHTKPRLRRAWCVE
jgi:hypothetical protein